MKKRFIAGANCPHCQQTDCLLAHLFDANETSQDYYQCVHCQHVEYRPSAAAFTQPMAQPNDDTQKALESVVKILPMR